MHADRPAGVREDIGGDEPVVPRADHDGIRIRLPYLLRTLTESGATFTSLVPTHYIMMLGLPAATRERFSGERMRKLLVSSAPARRDTKLAILEHFRNSGLFEHLAPSAIAALLLSSAPDARNGTFRSS